jgi:predicted methyltransferase
MEKHSRLSRSFGAAVLLAALAASFSLEALAQTDAATSAAIDAALAGSHRSEKNQGARSLSPSKGNPHVLRPAPGHDGGRDLAGRRLVRRQPPDLSVPEGEDKQKYAAIGESDRMTLKFRKPMGKT